MAAIKISVSKIIIFISEFYLEKLKSIQQKSHDAS